MTTTQESIARVCDDIKRMLIKKNEDYGNSFHEPINVFATAGTVEALAVRIDDKLKRYQNLTRSGTAINFESSKDTVKDLIGYLILWLVEAE